MPLTPEHVRKIKQIIRSKFTHQKIKPYLKRVLSSEQDAKAIEQMRIAIMVTRQVTGEIATHTSHHLIQRLCTKLVDYHEGIRQELLKVEKGIE